MDDEVRILELISGYTQNAPGSVLVSTGDTRIICTATFEEEVPGFLKLPETVTSMAGSLRNMECFQVQLEKGNGGKGPRLTDGLRKYNA